MPQHLHLHFHFITDSRHKSVRWEVEKTHSAHVIDDLDLRHIVWHKKLILIILSIFLRK